jgi:hypothetical protein
VECTEYEVREDGRVFSLRRIAVGIRKQLRQAPDSNGYPSVRICKDGKYKRIAVYRLVAARFLPERPPDSEVRHLDGDRTNSHFTNLAWGSRKDNADDRERHGRTCRGFVSTGRKMTPEIVAAAIFMHQYQAVSLRRLAVRYGVSYGAMRKAVKGITYFQKPLDIHAARSIL